MVRRRVLPGSYHETLLVIYRRSTEFAFRCGSFCILALLGFNVGFYDILVVSRRIVCAQSLGLLCELPFGFSNCLIGDGALYMRGYITSLATVLVDPLLLVHPNISSGKCTHPWVLI